jgi:hypothetical protein
MARPLLTMQGAGFQLVGISGSSPRIKSANPRCRPRALPG